MILGARNWIRIGAAFLMACGASCISKGAGVHPYYFTLTFSYLAEAGALLRVGLILTLIGVVVFAASFIRDPFEK
jgi:hypothetical protein